MIQKKICLLGSFAVGKTSLLRRYVDSMFSDAYKTTLGVKVDKKVVTVENQKMAMILWDVQGQDHAQDILPAYLQGMAGYILVVDPTREYTMTNAILLTTQIAEQHGPVPYIVAMNKCDLKSEWAVSDEVLQYLSDGALDVIETSAKSGTGVEDCFQSLALEFLPTKSGATN